MMLFVTIRWSICSVALQSRRTVETIMQSVWSVHQKAIQIMRYILLIKLTLTNHDQNAQTWSECTIMAIQSDQFDDNVICLQHMKGLKKGLKDELRRDARLIALADDIDKHVQYFDGTSLRTVAYTHQRTRLGSDWLPELVNFTNVSLC